MGEHEGGICGVSEKWKNTKKRTTKRSQCADNAGKIYYVAGFLQRQMSGWVNGV